MRRRTFDALMASAGLVLAVVLLVAGGLLTPGAGALLVLSGLGVWHLRRVSPDAQVLTLGARTPAPIER